jgi:hypothetical protein
MLQSYMLESLTKDAHIRSLPETVICIALRHSPRLTLIRGKIAMQVEYPYYQYRGTIKEWRARAFLGIHFLEVHHHHHHPLQTSTSTSRRIRQNAPTLVPPTASAHTDAIFPPRPTRPLSLHKNSHPRTIVRMQHLHTTKPASGPRITPRRSHSTFQRPAIAKVTASEGHEG